MALSVCFASALSDPNANTSYVNPVPGRLDPGWVCASYSLVPAWPFLWCQELVSSGMELHPPELLLRNGSPREHSAREQSGHSAHQPAPGVGQGTGLMGFKVSELK